MEEFVENQILKTLPCCKLKLILLLNIILLVHLFHDTCIDEWLKENETCPICKSSILASENNNEQ